MIHHLYIHIPFCAKICPYCAFYKELSDAQKMQAFLDALLLELDRRQETLSLQPRTIFFGGGTPSILSVSQMDYLLSGLRARLDLSELKEWTLEMNPATVSLAKARLLLAMGVNRISMGVQSWEPHLLEALGRVHSAEQAEKSYFILREAGFTNVNLDFIFGIPTQTTNDWEKTLYHTIALNPEHVSAYCLTYETDTEFFERFRRGELVPDENADADQFQIVMKLLESSGYRQYEISNYAKPDYECLHNLAYWNGSDYLGLGPSAFSTVGNQRWQNVPNTARYIASLKENEYPMSEEEIVSPEIKRSEQIAFALRTNRGIALDWLSDKESEVREFMTTGLLQKQDGHLILTSKGRMVADSIAEVLM